VTGLKGGHSGIEIDKGRGNAIKIMNRALQVLTQAGARLSSIDGGDKHNAIPRECDSIVLIPSGKIAKARRMVETLCATIKVEVATVDPDLLIELVEADPGHSYQVIKRADQKQLLLTLSAIPHGVIKMSADIPGLVETSTNLAVISTIDSAFRIVTSQRSSVASEIEEILDTVSSVLELSSATVEHTHGYPGWKPDMESPILKISKSAYQNLYGKEPIVKAIHAGLECGVLGERIPGMDMVSFGPTLEAVHSPDERIHIDTVDKFWVFLLQVLKDIK
jgi:dipeptidase D